ncbi:MAG: helix-hairpin-helix domain-containing protein [Balneolaceae bacterium]|nr:helix-hairpin-helix domain-containing protein [Balneolaceae bacterium]
MRRRLFFLFEKLEINRSERIAISVLLVILVGMSGMLTFLEPAANYDEKEYRELEKIFKEKSESIREEEELILARYESNRESTSNISAMEDVEAETSKADTTDAEQPTAQSNELININTASNEQLQNLPGIGPAYAARIVAWRQENGVFTSKDQLLEIKGIGDKRLARIKPLITLE